MKRASKYDEPVVEVYVRGIPYKVTLLPKQLFNNRNSGAEAIHQSQPYKLEFSEQYCTLKHVYHELFHAYLATTFYHFQVNQSAEDLEEVACETFAEFGQIIVDQGKNIFNHLKAELDRRKNVRSKESGKSKKTGK